MRYGAGNLGLETVEDALRSTRSGSPGMEMSKWTDRLKPPCIVLSLS